MRRAKKRTDPTVPGERALAKWNAIARQAGFEDFGILLRKAVANQETTLDVAQALRMSKARVVQLARHFGITMGSERRAGALALPVRLNRALKQYGIAAIVNLDGKELAALINIHPHTARRYLRELRAKVLTKAQEAKS